MKAIVYSNYGSPDVLRCEEIERPTPGDDEVLIKVRAASVNPLDRHLMNSRACILTGLHKPKIARPGRPGRDVAGEVEAVGRNATQFKPGDEVFGVCYGAFAEYACAIEEKLALLPANYLERGSRTMSEETSTFRLYLKRSLYLLNFVLLGLDVLPGIINHVRSV
jgi:NADPH:quinone reductase-like Zn-dependent oxidoreductase